MNHAHDLEEKECYYKTVIWLISELSSSCCIFNSGNIGCIITGSICCYLNNCFIYYKYLECQTHPLTIQPNQYQKEKYDICFGSFFLPLYPCYYVFSCYKKSDIQIDIPLNKICPSSSFEFTVTKQPQVEDICPICLEPVEKNQKIENRCHTFHEECINNWKKTNFENSNKCPVCIQNLD